LPIVEPNEAELAAHEDVLTEIDKSSGGKTVWRSLPPVAPAAGGPMA
jgi:DNA polymerase-3 subunit epsilon